MPTAAGESTGDIYECFAAYERKRTKKIQERYSNKKPAAKSHNFKYTGFGPEVRSAYKQFQNSRLPLTKSVEGVKATAKKIELPESMSVQEMRAYHTQIREELLEKYKGKVDPSQIRLVPQLSRRPPSATKIEEFID